MSNSGKGYAFVLTSAFLAGAIFITGKVALTNISPEFLVAWIFSIAVPPLGIMMFVSGRWREILNCSSRDWINIIAFSAFSIAALQSLWMGIQHLDPTVAAFISRLQTLVSVLLGVIFLRERFGRWEIIGALLLIAGVVVIRIAFDVNLSLWFWVMVASGVFFGITEIFAKQAVGNLHPIPLNFIRNSIIALFFVIVLLAQGRPLFEFQGTWWHLLAIGIAGPLLSRLSFLNALSRIDVSKAVLVNQTQPIFVFLISFTILSAIPTLRELVGGLLILAGCVALIRGSRD